MIIRSVSPSGPSFDASAPVMQRINRELLDLYCQDDRIAGLLAEEARLGDEQLTSHRWLQEIPAKRLIYNILYGDLLDGGDLRIADIGGGLTALTRRLASGHRYELVDLMAHDRTDPVTTFRHSVARLEIHPIDWWSHNFTGPYDLVIANDIFPNTDQRLAYFLRRTLPVAYAVRLSLTYYEKPRFYLTRRVDADEMLSFLAWNGAQTASTLAEFANRIEEPDWSLFAQCGDSVFENGRQVVIVSLRGDLKQRR